MEDDLKKKMKTTSKKLIGDKLKRKQCDLKDDLKDELKDDLKDNHEDELQDNLKDASKMT